MSKPKVDGSKQPHLSVFFSPKTHVPVQLQNGWDGPQSSKVHSGQAIPSYDGKVSLSEVNDAKSFKKRILPTSSGGDGVGGYNNRSTYPPSSSYGIPKGTASIGGVSFAAPTGTSIWLITPELQYCHTTSFELLLTMT